MTKKNEATSSLSIVMRQAKFCEELHQSRYVFAHFTLMVLWIYIINILLIYLDLYIYINLFIKCNLH